MTKYHKSAEVIATLKPEQYREHKRMELSIPALASTSIILYRAFMSILFQGNLYLPRQINMTLVAVGQASPNR